MIQYCVDTCIESIDLMLNNKILADFIKLFSPTIKKKQDKIILKYL